MTTGEKIAFERGKLGLTQQQFANELGVTRQAVSRWESDMSFPETDKLIKMSEMFGCSIDYLLKYNTAYDARTEQSDGNTDETLGNAGLRGARYGFNIFNWSYEYKSKKTVWGMPLVHINIGLGRRAKGFFSVGLISSGIFSCGLLSAGVFSLGLLSLGAISLGCLSLGLLSLGSIALGILALGGVAAGIIAIGGVAIGCFSLGGCAIGLFACGGYANGSLVAVGDYATGQIALGYSTAIGSKLSVTGENFAELREEAWRLMDGLPSIWRGFVQWCKSFAYGCMQG